MIKKRLIFSLALAGACFQTGSLFAQYPDSKSYLSSSSVARIGDGASSIGDSDRLTRDTTASPDTRPAEFRDNSVNTSIKSDPLPPEAPSTYIPASYSTSGYAVPEYDSSSYQGSGGSAASCSSCGDSGLQMSCAAPSICDSGCSTAWIEGGALLWWRAGGQTPPLVTRHPNAGGLPVLGAPTEVLAGGEQGVGTNLLPGFYGGMGMWLDSSQCVGVGARAFGLFGGGNTQNYTFDGTRSLGVPFFNTTLGVDDAYLVGFNAGNLGSNTGSVSVATDLDLIGGEAYLRKAIIKNGSTRIDAVGGYLFTKLDDSLILRTNYTDGITNAIANGTNFTTIDQFSGSNVFHGGEFGLLAEGCRGKWTLSSGTKFALGNMNQTSTLSGLYSEVPPPNVGAAFTDNRGLLVQQSNTGTQTRNTFAFIPQVDLKLGYQVSCNLRFDVGYSFLYFSDVVLGGNQIDTNVDIGNVLAVPVAPRAKFETDSLILHGLNLGATFTF